MQREHTPQRPSIRHLLLGSVSRMVYSATHEVEGISRFEESGSSRLQRFDVFTQPRPDAEGIVAPEHFRFSRQLQTTAPF
jgi:hypothetical protein